MYNKRNIIILSISFMISALIYLFIAYDSLFRTLLAGIIVFLPFLFIFGILKLENHITQKATDENKIKIQSNIFLVSFLLFAQLCICFTLGILIENFLGSAYEISPLSYSLLKKRYDSKYTALFPFQIPNKAKVYSYYTHFGSSGIYLEFKADKEYIDKEIKKHKYKKIYFPQTKSIEMDSGTLAVENLMLSAHSNTEFSKLKFYIIDYKGYYSHHWPYSYGIATAENVIIFFYSNPDTI